MSGTAKFYVVVRSYQQGDAWKPVAGPYATRAEAEKVSAKLDRPSANLKDASRAKVVARTSPELRGWEDGDIIAQITEAEDARRGA